MLINNIIDNGIEYNSLIDVLYVKIKPSEFSYGHEEEDGVVINYDYDSKQVVGVDIWDFAARCEQNIPINVPFEIDFMKIYQEAVKK